MKEVSRSGGERGGVVFNINFEKGSLCTGLIPNTLYRKCIKFAPKNWGVLWPNECRPVKTPDFAGSVPISEPMSRVDFKKKPNEKPLSV